MLGSAAKGKRHETSVVVRARRANSLVAAACFPDPPPLPQPDYVQVAAGTAHSCGLTPEGSVSVGARTITGSSATAQPIRACRCRLMASPAASPPSLPARITRVRSPLAERSGAGARTITGEIRQRHARPIRASGAVDGFTSGVTTITAGARHACAITAGGAVRCWGENYYGQLGNGTTTDSSVPVRVDGLTSGVTTITAGARHVRSPLAGGPVLGRER